MNKNINDVKGSILAISQFTLYADTKKGNRPSFLEAMPYKEAEVMFDEFVKYLQQYVPTYKGVFGADMQVSLINDGPVTIIL